MTPDQIEAKILRAVAAALRSAYEPGYYGMGGPQDGEDSPPKFHAKQAAEYLEKDAEIAEIDVGQQDKEDARILRVVVNAMNAHGKFGSGGDSYYAVITALTKAAEDMET